MTRANLPNALISCAGLAFVALVGCTPASGNNDAGPAHSVTDSGNNTPTDSGSNAECASNSDCSNFNTAPICNTATGTCVGCVSNSDCASAAAPICDSSNQCTTAPSNGCTSDIQCSGSTPSCDTVTGVCGECSSESSISCGAGRTCQSDTCVVQTGNTDSGMNTNTDAGTTPGGYCAPCQSDSDCGGTDNDAGISSNGNYCVALSATATVGVCGTACATATDCPSTATCSQIGPSSTMIIGSVCLPTSMSCTTTGTTDAGMMNTDAGPGGPFVTVPLTGCPFLGFDAPVTIGGSQTFELDVDTGSTTTFVAASTCTSCGVTPEFNVSGATSENHAANSSYGSGSVKGKEYQDKVQIGNEMPVVTMNFGAITSQTGFFLAESCDGSSKQQGEGIVGFGPIDLSVIGSAAQDAYFNDLVATDMGLANTFAVNLCSMNGNMWFGGYDTSYASGAPLYTPVVTMSNNAPYWEVNVTSFGMGGTAISGSGANGTILDTGTGAILLPTAAYNSMVSTLSSNSGATSIFGSGKLSSSFFSSGRCITPTSGSTTQAEIDAALPTMDVTLPSTTSGSSITLAMPATQSYLTLMQGAYCGSISNGGGMTLIGAPGLRAYITIFDAANKRIGFAPQSSCK